MSKDGIIHICIYIYIYIGVRYKYIAALCCFCKDLKPDIS